MTAEEYRVAAVLLAAGDSKRLGKPKQLLRFEGETLIRRTARMLSSSGCGPVIVVLGAEADACRSELNGLEVIGVLNESWQEGMASSIRAGIEALLRDKRPPDAAIISLCDQPFVTREHIGRLIELSAREKVRTVAASYNGIIGVPAAFPARMFTELLELGGDEGARKLLRNSECILFDLPEAGIDIDTESDLIKALPLMQK